jgi:hypothetical protein
VLTEPISVRLGNLTEIYGRTIIGDS